MQFLGFGSPLFGESPVIQSGLVPVSGGHSIYFEVRGKNTGKPVVFLHGGAGRGCQKSITGFFNPRKYRIIYIDQRGCGRSQPRGCLENNNTEALIEDIEVIRKRLDIDKWMLFGCGWGSYLALRYAQKHPTCVTEIIVNNVLTFREKEIEWLFRDGAGASRHMPSEWRKFRKVVESDPAPRQRAFDFIRGPAPSKALDHRELLKRYYGLLVGDKVDATARSDAVAAWNLWEDAISGDYKLMPPGLSGDGTELSDDEVVARIACHYFLNKGFVEKDSQLLDGMRIVQAYDIKGVIVHGDNDRVCPLANVMELAEVWPAAQVVVVPHAGHSTKDHGIQKALVEATEEFAGCGCLFQFGGKKEEEAK
jgi:proline iminopeptidase